MHGLEVVKLGSIFPWSESSANQVFGLGGKGMVHKLPNESRAWPDFFLSQFYLSCFSFFLTLPF